MNPSRRLIPGFESTLAAIETLPAEHKVNALVQILTEALLRMPTTTLRRKRARFLAHFAQCGCSFEVCCAVQDLVDLHLAQRARRKTATRTEKRPDLGGVDSQHQRLRR